MLARRGNHWKDTTSVSNRTLSCGRERRAKSLEHPVDTNYKILNTKFELVRVVHHHFFGEEVAPDENHREEFIEQFIMENAVFCLFRNPLFHGS